MDGTRADEQPGSDLRIGEAVAGEPSDLGLLGGQLDCGVDAAFAGGLAGGQQFAAGPFGERLTPMLSSMSWAAWSWAARVEATSFASQPFPIEQMTAGELSTQRECGRGADRLPVEAVGARRPR